MLPRWRTNHGLSDLEKAHAAEAHGAVETAATSAGKPATTSHAESSLQTLVQSIALGHQARHGAQVPLLEEAKGELQDEGRSNYNATCPSLRPEVSTPYDKFCQLEEQSVTQLIGLRMRRERIEPSKSWKR